MSAETFTARTMLVHADGLREEAGWYWRREGAVDGDWFGPFTTEIDATEDSVITLKGI